DPLPERDPAPDGHPWLGHLPARLVRRPPVGVRRNLRPVRAPLGGLPARSALRHRPGHQSISLKTYAWLLRVGTRCGSAAASGAPRGRLHRHPARAPHQVEFEIDQLRRAKVIWLRAESGETVAKAPFQRAEALPFEPVERITGRVRLRDDVAREL